MGRVLVLGSAGQLGLRCLERFQQRGWQALGADLQRSELLLEKGPRQGTELLRALRPRFQGLDAVVNVAGGFAMGAAGDAEVLERTVAMVESSLYSSVAAAQVAAQMLRPGGLLILPGAAAAWSPTPWSLPYGSAKVAVHHLVRSLAAEPYKVMGLAPQVLDTKVNRLAMPDADHSTWATLEEVAEQIEAWCERPELVESGRVYLIEKRKGEKASYTPREAL